MNLVLGTALSYDVEQVRPFVNSLRKQYTDEVVFLVSDMSSNFRDYLNQNNIQTYKIPNLKNQDEICSKRHQFYKEIVQQKDFEKILLTDVRDVIFQTNPFSHNIETDLEFFLEPEIYKNCSCHRHWFCDLRIHGREFYEKISDKIIVCAGTTIGTKTGIMFYLDKMITELSKIEKTVTDQPTHAYLLYNNSFSNFKLYETLKGPISTLSKDIDLKFDSENNLLNEDGSIVSVVHQWDRSKYQQIFLNKSLS